MSLPFAHTLSNPCAFEREVGTRNQINMVGHRARFLDEFSRFVEHFSRLYQEEVQGILRNHTILGCNSLLVNNLPHTPTFEELKAMSPDKALNKIYLSFLVHSAYAQFIHYQFATSDVRCSNDIQGEQSLAVQSRNIAVKLKNLACYTRFAMSMLGYELDDVLPLLNVTITNLSLCSRRALRDCQVMKSADYFLGIVSSYVSRDDDESPSVVTTTEDAFLTSTEIPPSSTVSSAAITDVPFSSTTETHSASTLELPYASITGISSVSNSELHSLSNLEHRHSSTEERASISNEQITSLLVEDQS